MVIISRSRVEINEMQRFGFMEMVDMVVSRICKSRSEHYFLKRPDSGVQEARCQTPGTDRSPFCKELVSKGESGFLSPGTSAQYSGPPFTSLTHACIMRLRRPPLPPRSPKLSGSMIRVMVGPMQNIQFGTRIWYTKYMFIQVRIHYETRPSTPKSSRRDVEMN